jgi:hypothetical protein
MVYHIMDVNFIHLCAHTLKCYIYRVFHILSIFYVHVHVLMVYITHAIGSGYCIKNSYNKYIGLCEPYYLFL